MNPATTTTTPIAVTTHALGRIASCSFDDLMALAAPRSSALVLAAENAAAEVAEHATRLGAHLYEAVPRTAEPASRRVLVNAQREVFQHRTLAPATAERVRAVVDADGAALLDAYVRAVEAAAAVDAEAESVFGEEVEAIRARFRELLRGDVIQDSLALSSTQLLDSINRFYVVKRTLNGKDLDAETGAMKYFSRAAAKTSPFSKFTALTGVTLDDIAEPVHVGNPSMAMQSHVRLNARLLFLIRTALIGDPEARLRLPLHLNATVARTAAGYRFLTNFNNIEAFQQVAVHPAIDFVVERLREGATGFAALQAAIASAFECEATEADALIEKTLALGLVEVDLGVSALDADWDAKLAAILPQIEAPIASTMAGVLGDLRADARAFERANGGERIAIGERMAQRFAAAMPRLATVPAPAEDDAAGEELAVFEHSRVPRGIPPSRTIVYEDATVDPAMRVRRKDVEQLVASLDRLVEAFTDFDPMRTQRELLESFFTARYGDGATVPLLTLYEDYYRHRKELGSESPESPLTAARRTRTDQQISRLQQALAGRPVTGGEIHVSAADIEAAGLPDGTSNARRPTSRAMVLQCFVGQKRGRDVLCGVLNAPATGFGKLPNRFLHLLPSQATSEMRAWHGRIAGDDIFAEAVDASYFNANLHPPLMPFEIATPGGQTSLPPAAQIAVADLVVRAGAGGLALLHGPSGRRTWAFDCGLQRPASRSKLYELLTLFALGGQPWVRPLTSAIQSRFRRRMADGTPVIERGPRIVFDERLVLQRRSWHVPAALLPLRARGQSALSYFRQVDRWRRAAGMPRHVFATIHVRDKNESKARNKDDRKPQFVSFDNPLLVTVFEKMLPKADGFLEVAEMLPSPDQLLEIGGRRHVTEHVFQWYRDRD